MSTWIPTLNKNILAVSTDDYTKLQPLWNDPNLPEILETLSSTQLERLVLVLQWVHEGGALNVLATPQWASFSAYMNSGCVPPSTLAFWRFQSLAAQGDYTRLLEQYLTHKPELSAPMCGFLEALFLLESKLVSKRALDYNTASVVMGFTRLAKQIHRLPADDIEVMERLVFPMQLALRFDLLQAGKQGAKLKDGEKTSIHKKVASHLFFMVSAELLLNW